MLRSTFLSSLLQPSSRSFNRISRRMRPRSTVEERRLLPLNGSITDYPHFRQYELNVGYLYNLSKQFWRLAAHLKLRPPTS